jgi:hypothetical protein
MTTLRRHPGFDALADVDWEQPESILNGCTPLFDAARTDPTFLTELLDRLPGEPNLTEKCERYDFLDKLVLADLADLGVRVRLHLYRPGFFDRPHNHRWSFASNILRGEYRHRIFGRDDAFDEHTDTDALIPIHERIERRDDCYALHHTSVHTVQAEADTISLLVRGPAAKERFLIVDRAAGGFFWVYGADSESPEQRAAKRMTSGDLTECIARIRRLLTTGEAMA